MYPYFKKFTIYRVFLLAFFHLILGPFGSLSTYVFTPNLRIIDNISQAYKTDYRRKNSFKFYSIIEIRKNCKIFNFLDSFEFNLIWAQEKIKMFLKQQIKEEKESCIMF